MSRYLESERGSSSAFNLYDELGTDIDDGAGSTSGESTRCATEAFLFFLSVNFIFELNEYLISDQGKFCFDANEAHPAVLRTAYPSSTVPPPLPHPPEAPTSAPSASPPTASRPTPRKTSPTATRRSTP